MPQPDKEVFYGVVPKPRSYSVFLVIRPYTPVDFLEFYAQYPISLFHLEYRLFRQR